MGLANILYDAELIYRSFKDREGNLCELEFKRKGSSCRVLAALNL